MLQVIKQLSQGLDLHLDGEPPIAESPLSSKVASVRKNNRLTPAKFEAWKMWQEDGLSVQKVAVSLLKGILVAYFEDLIMSYYLHPFFFRNIQAEELR